MTYISILIGFQYVDDVIETSMIDLYRMYEITKDAEIVYVLTDIDTLPKSSISTIISKEVNHDAAYFRPDSDKCRENLYWVPVKDVKDLTNIINKIFIRHESRILIYYTGHGDIEGGTGSSMRLPSGEKYPFMMLRDEILSRSKSRDEIVFILDCCYSGNLDLPYKLDPDLEWFELVDMNKMNNFIEQTVVVVSSSTYNEISSTTERGSVFTKYLTNSISRISNMSKICKEVAANIKSERLSHKQTISIHCSYPIYPMFWSWLTNPKYDIYIDNSISCVIINYI